MSLNHMPRVRFLHALKERFLIAVHARCMALARVHGFSAVHARSTEKRWCMGVCRMYVQTDRGISAGFNKVSETVSGGRDTPAHLTRQLVCLMRVVAMSETCRCRTRV